MGAGGGNAMHCRFAGHSFVAFYPAILAANTITEMVATKSWGGYNSIFGTSNESQDVEELLLMIDSFI